MSASAAQLKLQYEGSVKRVFAATGDEQRLLFEFTDDYSVFDWGKMPDQIQNKGRALTVLGAVFFEKLADPLLWQQLKAAASLSKLEPQWLQSLWSGKTYQELCRQGLASHFRRLTTVTGTSLSATEAARAEEPVYMDVLKADIQRPTPSVVLGQTIYHYPQIAAVDPAAPPLRRLIPLEVVFRFGMPAGSSLRERLQKNPQYAEQLGLDLSQTALPEPNSWFPRAVLEFFTKLEPKDRLLSLSEAMLISGLSLGQFQAMTETAQLAALALFHLFHQSGIELWDGKFEFILDGDNILLADSIGPDELRLIYKGTHLSKEIIRQVYRGGAWESGLQTAQKLAAQRQQHEWKTICQDELKLTPEKLPAVFKTAIDHLYPVLANSVAQQDLFNQEPDLDSLVDMLSAAQQKKPSPNTATLNTGDHLKVLVIGSGGREHAICWKLSQSPLIEKIFCAPGNGGTALEAKTSNIDIAVMDFPQLTDFAKQEQIDLIVVGPDDPLAAGAVDHFSQHGLRVFGPNKQAAQLESSKAFAKHFMVDNHIPTARFLVCDNLQTALDAVDDHPWARVIKADGLALGKGVFVCEDAEQSKQALTAIFNERRFGAAGDRVVIEERLTGPELSLLLFCDGQRLTAMPASQDHKRRFDDDRGPNTGGMGAYSPVELYETCRDEIERQIIAPLNQALTAKTLEFQGVLFIGILVSSCTSISDERQYQPYVLEFNVRFGDPETQTLLPLLQSDLLPVLWACTTGQLDEVSVQWQKQASCCVVAACETYPESSSRGEPIALGPIPPGSFLFHAGSTLQNGQLVTNGGRILALTSVNDTMDGAVQMSYAALQQVSFKGKSFRQDIARRSRSGCLSQ